MSKSETQTVPLWKRRWVWILVVGVVLAGALAAIVWYLWLPQYRPGLRDGEVYGVDVSNHQGDIDWALVVSDNIDFAYIKATEGEDFIDAKFAVNWEAAREAGLDVGAYHFFTLCTAGVPQAENFLDQVDFSEAALPPVIDLELSGNCAERPTEAWVHEEVAVFLDAVERAAGAEALLYVGPDFDNMYSITDEFEQRVWHRRILLRPDVDRWSVWQFSYFADVDGIDGGVDLNIMRSPTDVAKP